MRGEHQHVSLDLLPEGLVPGQGVCGSATELPFGDETFDVVSAFDVVEHCDDDGRAVAELARVLTPGGRMLLSVPAYQWAWSDHDVQAGHHRRYTRPELVRLVEGSGMEVVRATYAFSGVFPLFVAERLPPTPRSPAVRRHPAPPGLRARRPRADGAVPGGTRGCCAAATCPTARRCCWSRSSPPGSPDPA